MREEDEMNTTTPIPIMHAQSGAHKGRLRRALKRVLTGLVIAIVALGSSGAIYQFIATQIDARNYPPPGQRVDVGGYKLHIYCMGENRVGHPTVILEQGLGG